MPEIPENLPVIKLPETAIIWDVSEMAWVVGYQTAYRRIKTVNFVESILFDSTDEAYTSEPFECSAYSEFILLIDLIVANSPTTIRIDVEFSPDNQTWFKYVRGPFGSLFYEDNAGNLKECIDGKIQANYMRLYLLSAGCTSSATFLMNVKAILR